MGDARFLSLRPVDTWFFRDGRPMFIGESSTTAPESVFPPLAPTLVGAIRLALARANGWSRGQFWKDIPVFRDVLGADEDLGLLRFTGPFLRFNGDLLGSMPLHILGKSEDVGPWIPRTCLFPEQEPTVCDLGTIRLPKAVSPEPGLKNGLGYFLALQNIRRALQGELALPVVKGKGDLWAMEDRIGIGREQDTRTTAEAALYSTRHVRLKSAVDVVMGINGLPDDWKLPTGQIPLGGEGRLADMHDVTKDIGIALSQSAAKPAESFCLALLTPADFGSAWPLPGGEVPGVPGSRIVSACVEKAGRIGGWSSVAFGPLPLKPMVPAGSVLFCTVAGGQPVDLGNMVRIGNRTEYGFGLCAVGPWNDQGV